MLLVGLTGSIGTGKSVVGLFFKSLGIPFHDADAVVHDLLTYHSGVKKTIGQRWPHVLITHPTGTTIDRKKLGDIVFQKTSELRWLESLLHPLVWESEYQFIQKMQRYGKSMVMLDIPLLFETGRHIKCDVNIVVTCSDFLQKQRVLNRKGMTKARFEAIFAHQLPSSEKVRHADFVIHTGLSRGFTFRQVHAIFCKLHSLKGIKWAPHWKREGYEKKTNRPGYRNNGP